MNRREFLGATAAALGARIELRGEPAFQRRLAERELRRGLSQLGADVSKLSFDLRVEGGKFPAPEAYSIATETGKVVFAAGNDQALLYSVYEFLERQGAFFGIDGDVYPIDAPKSLELPPAGRPWTAGPRFAVRGLLPWPDFLNCITVYNEEDFRAYFENMLRMRFNTFGMHVYTQAQQWAEPYLSFEFAGAGHIGYLDNTASNRWGYLPQRTSRYAMGASQFYDGEIFGSDSTRLGRNVWEIADRTREMLRKALDYAGKLGLKTGVGFEPYQIPDEIWRALPPEVKPSQLPGRQFRGARFDIESVTAKDLLEARLAQLLEAYPSVDHVWLWEDEGMNWESRRTGLPLSTTPFLQAHDFLRRHAPRKRLVVSGWGGVARHFADFHQRLPGDIVFSCLSDSLGWDPIHEVFSKLEGRERWPIPWLEDDPGMWLPQLHVARFRKDLDLAESYGCQGMIGIHWRHRIVDPTASFMARYSWDKSITGADHYRHFARTQIASPGAGRVAATLWNADENVLLLATGTGERKDGHMVTQEFSGDYSEGFTFWNNYEPRPEVMESQKKIALDLRAVAGQAKTPLEKERMEYITRHIEFLVPYAEAWTLAHRLHGVLQTAAKEQDKQKAKQLVESDGVPLWVKLAPRVREAMLDIQSIAATRNDLGTLASMQNKLVRLGLIRLRLSMKEFLGRLPPEVENLYAGVIKPDPNAPVRLFLPTRPSMLGPNEKVRLYILATGAPKVAQVSLQTRLKGSKEWTSVAAMSAGRRTYQVTLGPFPVASEMAEYRATATIGTQTLTTQTYAVTLA